MEDFKKGFIEVTGGIVGSIIISTLLSGFAKDGLIPTNMVYLFTAAGFLAALILMFSFKTSGVVFTIGWIAGAFLLRDILTTSNFIMYLVAPSVALVIRGVLFIKESHN